MPAPTQPHRRVKTEDRIEPSRIGPKVRLITFFLRWIRWSSISLSEGIRSLGSCSTSVGSFEAVMWPDEVWDIAILKLSRMGSLLLAGEVSPSMSLSGKRYCMLTYLESMAEDPEDNSEEFEIVFCRKKMSV
jgi:hypothetical protein